MDEANSSCNTERYAIFKRDFELKRNFLYETIVGVLDGEGKPYVAPLGVRVVDVHDDGQYVLETRVFTTAIIYTCLKHSGECTVHFPGSSQLGLFFLAFRDVLPDPSSTIVAPSLLTSGRSVHSPVIKNVANYLEAGVAWVRDEVVDDAIAGHGGKEATRGIFRMISKVVMIGDSRSRPINRQDGLTLELLVKASRLRLLPPGSKEQQANYSDLVEMLDKMEFIAPGDEKNVLARALIASLMKSTDMKP